MPFPNKATQFKKGNKANPTGKNGYVELKRLTAELIDQLKANDNAAGKAIVKAWVSKAKKGSFVHLKELLDRTEGKVKEAIEIVQPTEIRIRRVGGDRGRGDAKSA